MAGGDRPDGPARRAPAWTGWPVAFLLVGAFVVQSFFASLGKSPVYDEPPHIASGLSYLATHTFNANPQHPPLLKEMAALSLSLAGVRWPDTPLAKRLVQGGPDGANLEWPIGNDIIATNGPDRVMFLARLPFIVLAGVLGLLLYWWAREMLGPAAATGALLLYALDPNIIAHSFLVTTDVGVTAFTMLFFLGLWRYLNRPSWPRLVLCGLALGAALSSKFSAMLLLPIAALLWIVAARFPVARTDTRVSRPGLAASVGAFAAMCAIALVVVESVYFFPADPTQYLSGAGRVNADHVAGHQAYFNGELADRFYTYFVGAYLLKEPLSSIVLAVAGLALLWRSTSAPILTKLILLLPPAVFVATVTFLAAALGVRYIMPALPFSHLLGGIAFAALLDGKLAWGRPVAAALAVWLVVAAAGIYPDHLSYFNETACLLTRTDRIGVDGGSKCGPLWMDDSNVDWGQSVKQLRDWMAQNGQGRVLRLAYVGTFPPGHYGLAYEKVDPKSLVARPPPGLYAVSANWVGRIPASVEAVAPGATSWLRETEPIAIVGHAFYVYDIR